MCAFLGVCSPEVKNTFWNNLVIPHDLPDPVLPIIAKWLAKNVFKSAVTT